MKHLLYIMIKNILYNKLYVIIKILNWRFNMRDGKIVCILICIMLVLSSVSIIDNELNVEASGEGEQGESDEELDYEYLWGQIKAVANVTYDAYDLGDIRKGRFMGSKGGNYTNKKILMEEMENMGLNNVHNESIEQIGDVPIYYNRAQEVISYNLTVNINGENKTITKSEVFPNPTTKLILGWGVDKIHEFNGVNVKHNNFRIGIPWNKYFNSSQTVTKFFTNNSNYPTVIGNFEYISDVQHVPDSDDQEGHVYLIDRNGDSQDILDNLTDASGVVLANTSSFASVNVSSCMYQVKNINESEGTSLKSICENYTYVAIDPMSSDNFTVYYDFNTSCLFESNYTVIDRIPDHIELKNDNSVFLNRWVTEDRVPPWPFLFDYTACVSLWSIFYSAVLNSIAKLEGEGFCKGFILYSSFDHHLMMPTHVRWDERIPEPKEGWYYGNIALRDLKTGNPLPWYCINFSLGESINNSRNNTKIYGDINQKYYKGTENKPGLDAKNVIGELNIDKSPKDKYMIITNRYDGMWGQTPGDSGIGTAIVLALARHQKDLQENHSVDPKYNITYLFTTGEEIGFRGAYFHRDSLTKEEKKRIHMWIGFDQLGMNQSDVSFNPELRSPEGEQNNASIYHKVLWAIANTSDYENKSIYEFKPSVETETGGSEDAVWGKEVCDTIVFVRDSTRAWDRWHTTGQNYTNGDSLDYTDSEQVNLTYKIAWDFTKYICYDPDCWFTDISYQAVDSPKDGDVLADSIQANFTIKSIFPYDLVQVEPIFNFTDDSISYNYSLNKGDYEVNSSGSTFSYTFHIPDNHSKGDFRLHFKVSNSTGRINNIIYDTSSYFNDTSDVSNVFTLYHPFGCTGVGDLNQSVHDKIVGSVFTTNKNGYADNITAHINKAYMSPGPYKCMIYRKNDSKLIGTTTDDWIHRDYGNGSAASSGWAVFNFTDPKPVLFNNTEYVITCWGNNSYSEIYYKNFTSSRGRHNDTTYGGSPPDMVNFTNKSRLYSIYCSYTQLVEIADVSSTPNTVGFGFDVSVNAEFEDPGDILNHVKVNVSYPDNSTSNFTMNYTGNSTYEYVFSDTWLVGKYNFSIWAVDIYNNTYSSSGHSFNISSQASISVCTIKDEYGDNEFINVTDPPCNPPSIGYELLDDGDVLHMWNTYNSYYFDTDSGIQMTNHYDEYWSKNVMMLGYYNNDQWNLIYRTDELSGFNREVNTDNEDFVNATLWKDLNYNGYDFRLAIRYHLGLNDSDLTVIPYIKNLGEAIPYTLGFGWEVKDIKIADTYENDRIRLYNGTNWTSYLLNQSLDNEYTDMDQNTTFYLEGLNEGEYFRRTLYLKWNPDLDYLLRVKSRDGEYNAPVTLFIKVGTLAEDQEKYTKLKWLDSDEWLGVGSTNYHSCCGFDGPIGPPAALDGVGVWTHMCTEDHWLVLDLKHTYNIKKIRGRSNTGGDPTSVDIYISDDTSDWGNAVYSGITTWQDTASWAEVDILDTVGRYINISITSTEGGGGSDYLEFGGVPTPMTILDVYGERMATEIYYFDSLDTDGQEYNWENNPTYMVDGSISTYTSTNINDDLEKLTGNTCSGTNLGSISQVEIRAYGYYTNDQRDIILEPVFGGSNAGDRYFCQITNSAGWSSWLDVTDDAVAPPTWEWSDVAGLDCNVHASNGGMPFTLYCSKVEIRVRYRTTPGISNPSPADGSTDVSINPTLGITVSDPEGDAINITWLSNSSGSWQVFGTNNSVNNGTYYKVFSNATVNGQWWYWKVNVSDTTSSYNISDVYMFYTGSQSKIKNTDSTDIKGYMLMQVQYYNGTSEEWVIADNTVNETNPRTINNGEQLALDNIFNGLVNTSDLSDYGNGTYRAYVAFRDPNGNILIGDDETELVATYEFTVTFE